MHFVILAGKLDLDLMVRAVALGVVGEKDGREMLGALGCCARRLDLRAIKKFGLVTIEPESKESAGVAST